MLVKFQTVSFPLHSKTSVIGGSHIHIDLSSQEYAI